MVASSSSLGMQAEKGDRVMFRSFDELEEEEEDAVLVSELSADPVVLAPSLSSSPAVRKQRTSSKVRSSSSRYSGVDFGSAAPVPAPVVVAAGRRRDTRSGGR